jgi:hypothetical protein
MRRGYFTSAESCLKVTVASGTMLCKPGQKQPSNRRENLVMTKEEMEKAMEFILGQQAQSTTKIHSLAIAQERNEKKWERTEAGIRALLSIAEIHEREIANHTEQILAQGQQILSQSQQILSLGENTSSTDERLNALINIVERQISEGRNGKMDKTDR